MKLEKEEIAILVKATPEKGRVGEEEHTVGVIGVNKNKEILRLYPLGFRYGVGSGNFRKNDLLEVAISKPEYDLRWESRKVLSYTNLEKSLKEREVKERILPLSTSIERLNKEGSSLGIIKPEILNLEVKVNNIELYERQQYFNLIGDFLEKGERSRMPVEVRYIFKCKGEKACRGHKIILLDWEFNEGIRRIIRENKELVTLEKEIPEYAFSIMKEKEVYFVMGTHFIFGTWMIIGLYFPERGSKNQSKLSGFITCENQNTS
ncbi:MAG: hypothetical protein ACPK85_14540 [Methanosarcina sp.]